MQLKNRLWVSAVMLAALPQPGTAGINLNPFHHKHKPAADAPAAPSDDQTTTTTPVMTPAPPPADAQSQYDDVGYATRGITGGVSLAHPTLPQSSFVEVTNLDTGKTILAVVSAPLAGTGLIARLSPQAMAMLGGVETARVPVRVRRVNPSEQEQAALLNGRPAADRLDTPPFLLTALKRKLSGMQGQSASPPGPADDAAQTPPPVTKAAPKPSARPVAKATPHHVAPPPADDRRFIVEGSEGISHTPTRAHPSKAVTPAEAPDSAPSEPSGALYIQIASFSSEASAKALAARAGAGARVEQAGAHWRVRTGPYVSEQSAQAALGVLAAKGYREARVTH